MNLLKEVLVLLLCVVGVFVSGGLGGAFWFIKNGYGLMGIGYAYIAGQVLMLVCYGVMKIVGR